MWDSINPWLVCWRQRLKKIVGTAKDTGDEEQSVPNSPVINWELYNLITNRMELLHLSLLTYRTSVDCISTAGIIDYPIMITKRQIHYRVPSITLIFIKLMQLNQLLN